MIATWLAAKPHRATIVNIVMLTILLALVGNATLFALVGSLTVLVAAAAFLRRAVARTFQPSGGGHAYRLALVWVPGVIAIALSLTALGVITDSTPGGLPQGLAIVLFGFEVIVLAIGGADPDGFVSAVAVRG